MAATAQQPEAYVWAVDGPRCPDYWFPRDCPRAMAWRVPGCDPDLADRLLGPGVERLHVLEHGWLRALTTTVLWAYPFAAADFRPFGDPPHAHVADRPVTPLRDPHRVGDLVAAHAGAGIDLRVTGDLFGWWERVVASGLGFSGIRLRRSPRYREV